MDKHEHIVLTGDIWSAYTKLPAYKAKKQADRISYGWDSIIDRAHDGTSPKYEVIARELARPDRFQRRILAKSFAEAYFEFRDARRLIMRRLTKLGDTTYCFLFMEDGKEPRERRRAMLSVMCFVARGLHRENKKVVGVATEAGNRSYDFCLLVQPRWTAKNEEIKKKIQDDTGIFVNPRVTRDGEDEYPSV
jgi:hypothetical protein